MGLEIEAKMKLSDVAGIKRRLEDAGAVFVESLHETNIFLDTPDRSLLKAGCGLRVRAEDNVDVPETSRVVITHKGLRQAGAVKARPETELRVANLDDAVSLLGVLGYVEQLRFEKRRRRYRLAGCTIEMDELPQLGAFMEIEGPSESAVLALREELGLADEPLITESYASMVADYLQTHRRGETRLSFQ